MSAARAQLAKGIFTAGVVGLLVWAAGVSPAVSILVAFTLLIGVGLFVVPKVAIAAVGAFLLVQPLCANLAGGVATPLGLALHRLHEAFAVAAVARIAVFLSWDRPERRLYRWAWFPLAFLAVGAVSGLVAHVPPMTLALGAFLSMKFEVFLFLALTVPWTDRDCERIVRVALWLGPVLFASGVIVALLPPEVQRLFMEGLESDFTRGDFGVMHGILSQPGVFGWAMAVTGCYAVAAMLVARATWRRAAVGSLGASTLGILASLRRKPLVALPVAAAYGVMRFARGRRRWAVAVVFVLLTGGAAWLVADRLEAEYQDVLKYVDPTSPTAPRLLLYATGVEVANRYFPLGAGLGRFGGYASVLDYSPLYDEYGLSAVYGLSRDTPDALTDTYWPHIAAEAGWFGALILAAFYLLLVRRATRFAARATEGATQTLSVAAGLALIEALVESVAGPVFEVSLFAFVIGLPLGIVLVRSVAPMATPSPEVIRAPEPR